MNNDDDDDNNNNNNNNNCSNSNDRRLLGSIHSRDGFYNNDISHLHDAPVTKD